MANTNNDIIIKLLKCPKCLSFISPPSVICENGHILCRKCKEKECFMCMTEKFPNKNNYLFDYLLKEIIYPCTNKEHGCLEQLKFNELNLHEQICEYKLFSCMFECEGCDEKIVFKNKNKHEKLCRYGVSCKVYVRLGDCVQIYCDWRGFKQNLHQHVCQKHEFVWFTKNLESNVIFPWIIPLNIDYQRTELVKLDDLDEIFYFYTKYEYNSKLYLAIQYIGSQERASEFVYMIEFSNGNKKLTFEDNVLPSNLSDEEVFKSSSCFETQFDCLKKLFLAESCIDCNIKINTAQVNKVLRKNLSLYGTIIRM